MIARHHAAVGAHQIEALLARGPREIGDRDHVAILQEPALVVPAPRERAPSDPG
jgi:hypothetical protein